MIPYCHRCVARGSGLAPASHSTTGPWNEGKVTAMPGRCTPESRFMCICPAAHAPVLPALMTASQRTSAFLEPSFAILTIDESCIWRTATVGEAPIGIDSLACSISMRWSSIPLSLSVPAMTSSGPMRTSVSSGPRWVSALIHPSRMAAGAWSPPMTSMAMRIDKAELRACQGVGSVIRRWCRCRACEP